MKLEDQVCSIDNAKKLVELKLRSITSLYYYMDCGGMNYLRPRAVTRANPCDTLYPAYTVAELGEMLPDAVGEYRLRIRKCSNYFEVAYVVEGKDSRILGDRIVIDMLSNAFSNWLIWLIKNKHVDVEGLNND